MSGSKLVLLFGSCLLSSCVDRGAEFASVILPVYYTCHATEVEEDPMVTQNIRCLWQGGGAALIQTKEQFPQPKR